MIAPSGAPIEVIRQVASLSDDQLVALIKMFDIPYSTAYGIEVEPFPATEDLRQRVADYFWGVG